VGAVVLDVAKLLTVASNWQFGWQQVNLMNLDVARVFLNVPDHLVTHQFDS